MRTGAAIAYAAALAALLLEQRQCRRRWQVDACQGSLTLVIHEPAFARRAARPARRARRAPLGWRDPSPFAARARPLPAPSPRAARLLGGARAPAHPPCAA